MAVITGKQFTIDEYHQLIELKFLIEQDRIELIRGELIHMTPKGTPHTVCGSILCCRLDRLLGDRAVIRGKDPITLLNHSEPGPDVAIARGKDEDHLPIILTPKTFFSWRKFQFTLTYDQTIKLGVYAEAGITHY
jgi:Uma2 family endonuclease